MNKLLIFLFFSIGATSSIAIADIANGDHFSASDLAEISHEPFNQCERLEYILKTHQSENGDAAVIAALTEARDNFCLGQQHGFAPLPDELSSFLQRIEEGPDKVSCQAKLIEVKGRCKITSVYSFSPNSKTGDSASTRKTVSFYNVNEAVACEKICQDRRKDWGEERDTNEDSNSKRKMSASRRTCTAELQQSPQSNLFCKIDRGADGLFMIPAGKKRMASPEPGSVQYNCEKHICRGQGLINGEENHDFAKKRRKRKRSAKKSRSKNKTRRSSRRGGPKIMNNFRAAHNRCAPGCSYGNWGIWGDAKHRRRRSCHNAGEAIDVPHIRCNGKTYKALSRKFNSYVSCMRKTYGVIYRSKNHYNHAHFQLRPCRMIKGN